MYQIVWDEFVKKKNIKSSLNNDSGTRHLMSIFSDKIIFHVIYFNMFGEGESKENYYVRLGNLRNIMLIQGR